MAWSAWNSIEVKVNLFHWMGISKCFNIFGSVLGREKIDNSLMQG